MTLKNVLLLSLVAVTVWFVWAWVALARKARAGAEPETRRYTPYHAVVGFVFGFLDTLGLGNFAPTTAAFKLRSTVADEHIPGTLNVGYALPTIAQALIYISVVEVDALTLVLMIAAAVLGAWLGAGLVARWPRRTIQLGMGVALLVAAGLMLKQQLMDKPPDSGALELTGTLLLAGLIGNFALGALMTVGVGLYGPCLLLVTLLGMNPDAAFPIMMGSCAFLMPVGGVRFIRAGSYSPGAAFVLTCAALPAVVIAAYIVQKMDLQTLRWLVLVVVVYTAALMLYSAFFGRQVPPKGVAPETKGPIAASE